MIDKGYTRGALKKIAKVPKDATFSLYDVAGPEHPGGMTGMSNRMIQRGIIKKVGYGQYVRLSDDPVTDYYASLKKTHFLKDLETQLPATVQPVDSTSRRLKGATAMVAKAIAALPIGQNFSRRNLAIPPTIGRNARDSALSRLVRYGLVEHIGFGTYRTEYSDIVERYYTQPRGILPVATRTPNAARDFSVPYGSKGQYLIKHGNDLFLGIKVALKEVFDGDDE